jgi:DNA-binding NtrC family response regulator
MSLSMNQNSEFMPLVLLHDCEYMLRKTFALLAAEMRVAKVIETSELNLAKERLTNHKFDMVILGFDQWSEEIHLIQLIKTGMTAADINIPIIAMVPNITSEQFNELKSLGITEIFLKPARIKTIQGAFVSSLEKIHENDLEKVLESSYK